MRLYAARFSNCSLLIIVTELADFDASSGASDAVTKISSISVVCDIADILSKQAVNVTPFLKIDCIFIIKISYTLTRVN